MPNVPAPPKSNFDRNLVSCSFGAFGGVLLWDALGFFTGALMGISSAYSFLLLIRMSPHERVSEIKRTFPIFAIFFAVSLWFLATNYPPTRWAGGGGSQLYVLAFYLAAGGAGANVITRYCVRVSRQDEPPVMPTFMAHTAPLPTSKDPLSGGEAKEAEPGLDPFAFDAARFEAARAAPPPSFFLTQLRKLNVDLSSDHEAQAFAGALNTQAKAFIIHKMDEEINDPNTPLELRHFLLRVRAYLLGQTPTGELPRLEDKR